MDNHLLDISFDTKVLFWISFLSKHNSPLGFFINPLNFTIFSSHIQ